MRVLLVEDDPSQQQSIKMILETAGMVVDTTDLGEDGLEIGKLYDYDIIVLDIMLPDIDGFEVLRRLRDSRVDTPVLILSGLTEAEDKVKGLGTGADDYMTKPFNNKELLARIQAIIRRSAGHSQSIIETGLLKVNMDSHTVEVEGQPIHLTGKEIRDSGTPEPAQGDDPDQGNVPQPPLWRHGRARIEDHRRLHLQAAQETGRGHRWRNLHRNRLGPRVRAEEPGKRTRKGRRQGLTPASRNVLYLNEFRLQAGTTL